LVNPGSVGQPRDGDPRASFAIWDEERGRIEFYRVEYDIALTQEKMRTAQLPSYLIDRLAHGR
jgi:diadenosine tetraphosphatase ApaH/serine/threonine PP2A family protein phosphatase